MVDELPSRRVLAATAGGARTVKVMHHVAAGTRVKRYNTFITGGGFAHSTECRTGAILVAVIYAMNHRDDIRLRIQISTPTTTVKSRR